MPTPYDFVTLAQTAGRLKVSTTDALLPGLITAASQALANHLGYDAHLREEEVETVPSEGGRRLVLRAGALRQVRSITVGGAEVPSSEYFIESPKLGRIARRTGRWPFTGEWTEGVSPMPLTSYDTGEIIVTYDAGWRTPGQVELAREVDPATTLTSDLPAPLQEAALLVCTAWYRRAGSDPDVTSKSIGAGSLSWGDKPALTLPAQQLAQPYYKSQRRKQT